MWRFNHLFKLLPLLLIVIGCSSGKPLPLKAKGYIISAEQDALSEKFANYFFNHFSQRTKDKSILNYLKDDNGRNAPAGYLNIHLELAKDLKHDYCIEHNAKELHIRVRNEQTSIWMTYQLIDAIAQQDKRFASADLPPSFIQFNSQCNDFDFNYREPYFEPNLKPDYAPIIGTDNLEESWGIWGHNLLKIVTESTVAKNENLYALINGKRNYKQLNFSSPELFQFITDYILENYGDGSKKSYRLMIMPQDNDLVCTCPTCLELGNTSTNATPAVVDLINKLAAQFPKHQFFTTAYRTTNNAPNNQLAENAGVLFSTINLPKGIHLDNSKSSVRAFEKQLLDWQTKTPNIYIWDYAANFDDYLTPIPILYGLQQQLSYYKSIGIKGIFLNASGYDYSPFDDLKTYVAAALMMDIHADISALCSKYLSKFYPVSHALLYQYYMGLELNFEQRKKPYNMYGGMRESLSSYLNADKFVEFYQSLKNILPKTKDTEHEKLLKLLTALSYTRLQIAYTNGIQNWGYAIDKGNTLLVKPDINQYLTTLKQFKQFGDLKNYKEENGSLSVYINNWQNLLSTKKYENILMGTPVQIISKPDEGFEKSDLLVDGTPGFANDYHQGWYLSSINDLKLKFSTEKIKYAKEIHLCFLIDEQHNLYAPEEIVLMKDAKLYKTINSNQLNISKNIASVSIKVDFSTGSNISLYFIRKKVARSILACDEIQILK
ncbi:DUF4838 domain-containing protein [Arachidicoccus soli]|uniref:DUF4838 domain-containing protein n=1 Tax=Arachidicoccus soli TaxID=2341117 RepID=A0A386HMR8_9BACT|nr:DUF4838 domain-containing protein [Arachidicoccus soli]AYD47198.1 DUF4838 domain-containing protein [Arachidicoccus soli]